MQKSTQKKFKRIVLSSLAVISAFIFVIMGYVTFSYITTPLNVEALTSTNLGIEIYNDIAPTNTQVSYTGNKKVISFSQLQPHTINAFISIEDKRFYTHNGYDLKRIAKAGLVNLKSGSKSQGASTITQQLVKNILLNSEKTYSRKFKEILLSIKTEKNFSKEEILNMYLNSIYFGSNAYGVESASNLYFNKSAHELDINESAILAGIIKSPAYYSPIHHKDNCFKRKNLVLQQMYENGYINEEEYQLNIKKPVEVSHQKNTYDNSYNQQVILEACELLNITEKELLRQQLTIYTYQDDIIQQQIQSSLQNSAFAGDKLSMVADNNGKVLAYLGNSSYDLSNMRRTPASTLKPLLVYLPAISLNLISPASPILDEPILEGYAPKNAGEHYMGWISAREALAHSSNVCAVQLANHLGLDKLNEYGYKFSLYHSPQQNMSLALGDIAGGVKIMDLAHAYSILQNNGVDKGLTFIKKIENKHGRVIYQDNGYENKVFEQEDCMLVNDMLKTCALEGTAKRLSDLGFEVASKTGTAQINGKNTDLWNIAYTPNHLALTWCGDATSKGLENNLSSGFYPTMINKNILSQIYSQNKPVPFKLNENIVKIALDALEYDNLHTLSLAPDNALERYTTYDIFKVDNIPQNYSQAYVAPEVNLTAILTTDGAKISANISPMFDYKIVRKTNKSTATIDADISDNHLRCCDDEVFQFDKVSYYVLCTNKHTNQQFTSNVVELYPESFLVNYLNEQFLQQNRNTKTKWYI